MNYMSGNLLLITSWKVTLLDDKDNDAKIVHVQLIAISNMHAKTYVF